MSLIGLDTPDFLPGPQLGQGFVQFGKTLLVPASSGVSDGPFYIGQFDKCWAAITPTSPTNADFFLSFSNDAAGTHKFSTVNVPKNSTATSLLPMDALGQFVYMNVDNYDTNPHNFNYSIFGTNSDSRPAQLYMPVPAIDVVAFPAPATTDTTIMPTYVAAGRYKVWSVVNAPIVLEWEFWNTSSWDLLSQVDPGGSPGTNFELYMPAADWRIVIHNTTAGAVNTWISMNGPY